MNVVWRSTLALIAACAGLLGVAIDSADAHAILETSIPANGAILEESPREIRLDFDESISSTPESIRLFDSERNEVEMEPVAAIAGATDAISATVAPLEDGAYVAVFRVTSSDGHPISGAITFTIGDAASDPIDTAAVIDDVAGNDGAVAAGRVLNVARWIAMSGLIVLLGSMWLVLVGAATAADDRRIRLFWYVALAALAAGTVAQFMFQAPYTLGRGFAQAIDPSALTTVLDTRFGGALTWRGILMIVAAGLVRALHLRDAGWWSALALATGIGLCATFAFSGHPSAFVSPGAGLVLDVVHLVAVSVWIGGLVGLAVGLRQAWFDEPTGEALARRYSTWALIAVPVIALTGVVQAARVGGLSLEGAYGKRLAVKVALVVVIVVLGAFSRRALRRGPVASIRRTITVEIAIAAVVLGVTSVLVATTPRTEASTAPQQRTLVQGDLVAYVTVTPARTGTNQVHVTITPPGGTLEQVRAVTVRFTNADAGVPPIAIDLERAGPNHFTTASATLPFGGAWNLDLVIEPLPNQSVLLRTTVEIAD